MSDRNSPARPAGRTVVRKRKINRWNEKRKQTFLVVLSETANVRRAAQRVRMSLPSAYDLKKRDPAFARAWREALEIGYSELELSLLRQSVEGSERVERVEIGQERQLKYVKTVRVYPFKVAMGLLAAHRAEVMAYRETREGLDNPQQSATDRAKAWLEEIDARLAASEGRDGDGAGAT